MHKRLLLLSITALLCFTASAQFTYTFKDTTTAYTPLSGASSLNGSVIWDDEDFSVTMPFTWKMDSTISQNSFKLSLAFWGFYDNFVSNPSDVSGFLLGEMDIADRGNLNNTASLSPIRYQTSGTTPNRIFKVEMAGAGFFDEMAVYNTNNDSVSLQVWIYETSNIVELHYGPSNINHAADYFAINGAGPLTGYIKHGDFNTGAKGYIYHLKGNASSPSLDSVSFSGSPTAALNSWPANGKVYRFSPKKPACNKPLATFTASTPVGLTIAYSFTGTTTSLDSLVWNFGDGTKLKVSSAYTTPITHTYTTAGRYNVSVTAYNVCGSTISAVAQNNVSVGSIAQLGNVSVYPNPARNVLTVEGMSAGSTATIISVIGQTVLRTDISSSKEAININALPAGTYSLLLSTKDGATGTMRFSKQ